MQALQLIRGGRDRRLQTAALLQALPLLDGARLLPRVSRRGSCRRVRVSAPAGESPADDERMSRLHRCPKRRAHARAHRARMGACRIGRAAGGELDAHRERVSRAFQAGRSSAPSRPRPSAVGLTWQRSGSEQPSARAPRRSPARAGFARRMRLRACCWNCAAPHSCGAWMSRGAGACRGCCRAAACGHRPSGAPLPHTAAHVAHPRGHRPALGVFRAAAGELRGARPPASSFAATVSFSPQQIAAYPLLLDELIDERLLSELPSAPIWRASWSSSCRRCATMTRSARSRRCATSSARRSSASRSPT